MIKRFIMLFVAFSITLLGGFADVFCFSGSQTVSDVHTVTAPSPFLIADVTVEGGASIVEKNISGATVTYKVLFNSPGEATSIVTFKAQASFPEGTLPQDEIPPDEVIHEFTAVKVAVSQKIAVIKQSDSDNSVTLTATTTDGSVVSWSYSGLPSFIQTTESDNSVELHYLKQQGVQQSGKIVVTATSHGCSDTAEVEYCSVERPGVTMDIGEVTIEANIHDQPREGMMTSKYVSMFDKLDAKLTIMQDFFIKAAPIVVLSYDGATASPYFTVFSAVVSTVDTVTVTSTISLNETFDNVPIPDTVVKSEPKEKTICVTEIFDHLANEEESKTSKMSIFVISFLNAKGYSMEDLSSGTVIFQGSKFTFEPLY